MFSPGYKGFVAFCAAIDQPLAPFQREIARAVFGPEREIVVILPRGNAKTTTAALLALHKLVTEPHASISLGAASREQGAIAFAVMRSAAEHPALRNVVAARHLALRTERGGILRVVSGKGERAHGQTDDFMLGDEVWNWPNAALLEAFETALIKKPDARLVLISTSAARLDTPLGRLRTRALAGEVSLKGTKLDARARSLRWLEWSLPDGEEPTVANAAACNPAPWITKALLAEQFERVTPLSWAQFHCCQWGAGEGAWLPVGAWRACRADYVVEDGAEVVLGVDIGGSRAASAVVAVECSEPLRVAHVGVFNGNDSVLDATAAVIELAGRFNVREIAYDPWRFKSEALRLEAEGIGPMVEFPQSHARMLPASERLASVVIERQLQHPGHPELDAHIAQAVAKPTGRGWRLSKLGETQQIDAAIALCMAVERASAPVPEVKVLAWL